MSIRLKFVELTADVLDMYFIKIVFMRGRTLRCTHQLSFHAFLCCCPAVGFCRCFCCLAFCRSLTGDFDLFDPHGCLHFVLYCRVVLSGPADNPSRSYGCAVSLRAYRRRVRPFITCARQAHLLFKRSYTFGVLSLSFHECP